MNVPERSELLFSRTSLDQHLEKDSRVHGGHYAGESGRRWKHLALAVGVMCCPLRRDAHFPHRAQLRKEKKEAKRA